MADELESALLDFLRELRAANLQVFLGGGYGLYVKQLWLQEAGVRTFLPSSAWPRPRATADLDVFLPAQIIVDHDQMASVRRVLDELGYTPDPNAKFMHFVKSGELGHLRVELLTGPSMIMLAAR
jgi:hypothetical protein